MTDIARLIATLVLAVIGAGALISGRAPQSPPPVPQTQPTFRTAVEAVQVTAIVTNAAGNPVAGLVQDDFEILENGIGRADRGVLSHRHPRRAGGANGGRDGCARQ